MRNMPSPKSQKPAKDDEQVKAFRKAARELGCDEEEAAFEVRLKKIAAAPSKHAGPKVVKRKPTKGVP